MTSQNGAEILGELRRFTNVPEWLSPIADTDLVTEALRSSPPFAPDALKLEAVQIGRVRLKKKRWSGLYRLTVTDQAGIRREVALQGTLIPSREAEPGEGPLNGESWRGFVPALRLVLAPQPPDDALGDLDPLTNPAQAADLLESVLRGSSPVYESVRFASCHPTVLRYKPGSRATVHFDLRYARSDQDRGWPDRVIAKTYRDLKGAATYEAMRALWESPLVDPHRLKLADPLAFDKDLHLLIQGHIPNTGTLRELIREARRADTPQRRRGSGRLRAKDRRRLGGPSRLGRARRPEGRRRPRVRRPARGAAGTRGSGTGVARRGRPLARQPGGPRDAIPRRPTTVIARSLPA